MFSSHVVVFCGDGHAIFDVHTGNNVNYTEDDKRTITLEDHVWIGYQSFLLPKTHVKSGSIIGARSLTNKEYPNNCIIAGSPAKVIKKDVAWGREPLMLNVDELDTLDYITTTQELS